MYISGKLYKKYLEWYENLTLDDKKWDEVMEDDRLVYMHACMLSFHKMQAPYSGSLAFLQSACMVLRSALLQVYFSSVLLS